MSTVNGSWRGPNIIKNGLVLYLDASSINSYNTNISTILWKDISGRGYTGTLTNGPTYSSENGGSFLFDGTNDYVSVGTLPTLSNMSIQMFVRVLSNAGFYKAFAGAGSTDYLNGFNIDMQSSSTTSFNKCSIEGGFLRVGGGTNLMTSGVTFGTWANICYTISPTYVQFYLNGLPQSGTTRLNNTSTTINMTNLVIGARPFILPSTSINANIATVYIYNRALSDSEVLQNYNAAKSRFG